MNNPFMFGVGPGHLGAKARKIIRDLDPEISLINGYDRGGMPCNGSPIHWFTAPNLGEPFNSNTAQLVLAAIKAAGGCYARGHKPR